MKSLNIFNIYLMIIRRYNTFLNENYKQKKNEGDLVRILRSKAAHKILDNTKADGCTFQEGGCWIAADAIIQYYKNLDLPLYVVYNNELGRVEHFVVKINDIYLDSEGYKSKYQLIADITNNFKYKYTFSVIPYTDDLDTEDIVRDLDASSKLVKLFER